jgi:hypothetical protein
LRWLHQTHKHYTNPPENTFEIWLLYRNFSYAEKEPLRLCCQAVLTRITNV